MKELRPYVKPYMKEVILAPVFKLLEAVFELVVPMVIAGIVDQSLPQKDIPHLWTQVGLLLLFAVVGVVVALLAQYYSSKAAVGYTKELTKDVYQKVIYLPKESRDRLSVATLVTRLSSDTYQIQTGINQFLRLFLRAPIIVFGAMFMAHRLAPSFTVYFLVMVATLALVIGLLSKMLAPLYRQLREKTDQLVQETRQELQGMRVIRAFGQEKRRMAAFQTLNQEYAQEQLKTGFYASLLTPLTFFLVNGTLLLIIWQGYFQIQLGDLSQGTLIALINYLLQILVELIKLAMLITSLNQSYIAAKRIAEIFQTKEEDVFATLPTQEVEHDLAIKVENLSFFYPKTAKPALEGVSFEVKRGEMLGVIGGTGSGKSTLAQLLLALYPPTQGELLIAQDGKSPHHLKEWRSWLALVPQKTELFRGTVRSNLTLGLDQEVADDELWQVLALAQADNFVAEKEGGLEASVASFGRNFSGGQRQRLSIARAVLRKPSILILDDATSALDSLTEAKLFQALNEKLPETTLVVISQRTKTLEQADYIIVLDKGWQVESGQHQELLKNKALYLEIYQSQHRKEEATDEETIHS